MFEFASRLIKYPVVFLVAAALCVAALRALGRCAPFLGLVDRPRRRHVHRKPIPLIGGLAIFAAFGLACLLVLNGPWGSLQGRLDSVWLAKFAAIGGAFLALGVVDDRFELKPFWKLAGQILAATLAYGLDVRFGRVLGMAVPAGLDWVATAVWFVAIVNAFNLIDGMDGVAVGVAITGGLGLTILFGLQRQPGSVMVLVAMLGACAAFLRYNFHPAKYFLGDAGSMLLGAFFSTVALSSNTKSATVASLGFPLLVVGVPLMDSMLAIWRRLARKVLAGYGLSDGEGSSRVTGGDLEHLHHRLARQGHSPRSVAYILYGINAFLVLVGLLVVARNSLAVGTAFIAFAIMVYVVVRHLATLELSLSGEALIAGLHRPQAWALPAVAYPVYDCLGLMAGYVAALALLGSEWRAGVSLRLAWLYGVPLLVSAPMGSLFVFGAYRRLWSRARVSEYAALLFALAFGVAIGVGVLDMLHGWTFRQALLLFSLLLFFDAGLLGGARALPRVAVDWVGVRGQRRLAEDARRVLVYGAGHSATLLLREMTLRAPGRETPVRVLGVADDNPAMWRRMIYGYPVVGGIGQACERMERGEVDGVTIACHLRPETFARLAECAERTGVRLERWACVREPVGRAPIPADGAGA